MRKIFATLFIVFSIYELGNLTGFSWKRLEYVSKDEIIDVAVRYSYSHAYSGLKDMQADYSKFKPEVRYWGSWSWDVDNGLLEKLFGLTRYQVRLPEEVVMVTVDGEADFSRGYSDCGDDESGCAFIPPDNPEQGIVGTVQHEGPNYDAAESVTAEWEGEDRGSVFTSGHCFSAYISSPINRSLSVGIKGGKPITLRRGYGFHLVAITGNRYYGSTRISKAEFLRSKSCAKEARQAWPQVGGWAWKR